MTTPTLTTTPTLATTGAFLGHLNTSDRGKVNPEGIEEKSTQYSHLKSWTGMNIFRRKYWLSPEQRVSCWRPGTASCQDAGLGQSLFPVQECPLKPVTTRRAETRMALLFSISELKASLVMMHVINRWFGGLGNGKRIHLRVLVKSQFSVSKQAVLNSPDSNRTFCSGSSSRLNMKKDDLWWCFMERSLWILGFKQTDRTGLKSEGFNLWTIDKIIQPPSASPKLLLHRFTAENMIYCASDSQDG